MRGHALVVEPLGELERALDVLARGLVVALAAPAAGAPVEDLRAEQVAREPERSASCERLVEAARPPSRCSKACSGRRRAGRGCPRGRRRRNRALRRARARARAARSPREPRRRPGAPRPRRRASRTSSSGEPVTRTAVAHVLDLLERLVALVRLGEGLGTREHRLDPAALVGRDAVLQEVGVDPEPLREPLDRLARRARLAALDLAHVLLAEARRRRGRSGSDPADDAELAQRGRRGGCRWRSWWLCERRVGTCAGSRSQPHLDHESATSEPPESPKRGMDGRKSGEASDMPESLDSSYLTSIVNRPKVRSACREGRDARPGTSKRSRRDGRGNEA